MILFTIRNRCARLIARYKRPRLCLRGSGGKHGRRYHQKFGMFHINLFNVAEYFLKIRLKAV